MKSFNSFSVVLLKPFYFFELYSFLISQKIYQHIKKSSIAIFKN